VICQTDQDLLIVSGAEIYKGLVFLVREANAGNRRAARSLATRFWWRGAGSKLWRHEL